MRDKPLSIQRVRVLLDGDSAMRMAITVGVYAACCAAAFGQAERPEDLAGWRKVKWGMSVEQAQDVLGAEAEAVSAEVSKAKGWTYGNGAWPTRLQIPDYELVGQSFAVKLGFDEKEGLKIVGLGLKAQPQPIEATGVVFNALETQLTEKYGSPSLRKNDRDTQEATWTLAHTVISLRLMKFRPSKTFLSFTYTPRGDDRL